MADCLNEGTEFENAATELINQLDCTIYGVKRTMVNGVRTSAAALIILNGYNILRTFLSGPVLAKAVFSNVLAHKVRRKTAFPRHNSKGIDSGI
jgi:hypothetical protein